MGVVGERKTTIDGITYTTVTLPGREACWFLPRLYLLLTKEVVNLVLTTIFPALFPQEAMAADGAATIEEAQARITAAANTLGELFSSPGVLSATMAKMAEALVASPEGLEGLAPRLLATTRCDQIRIGNGTIAGDAEKLRTHFDGHFAGPRVYHLLKLLVWVIGVNFTPPSGADL